MNSPVVGFDSYVDIATCMVTKEGAFRKLHQYIKDSYGSKGPQESISDRTGADFEVNLCDPLKSEWRNRIQNWQNLYQNNGPRIEDYSTPKDFAIGAFFLQHPIAAM